MQRRTLVAGLGAAAATAGSGWAFAQSKFPDRPLRLVVPFAAGGPTDLVARLVAAKMGESMGQTVLVENRGGGAGTIGAAEVAKAPADGYTLLFQNISTAVITHQLYKKLPYDAVKDFQPVSRLADIPNVLIVNRDAPAKNLKELIALLRAHPGKFNYGSSGAGTILHLSAELFRQMTGTDLAHVAYKGSAPAMVDIYNGSLLMMFDNLPGQIEPIRSGKVRAIGVTTPSRVPILPEVPTLAEAGLPEFRNASWFALFVRSGTPADALKRLEAEAIKAVHDPAIHQRIRELGGFPVGSTAAELDKFWRAEIEQWRPLITKLNLTLD